MAKYCVTATAASHYLVDNVKKLEKVSLQTDSAAAAVDYLSWFVLSLSPPFCSVLCFWPRKIVPSFWSVSPLFLYPVTVYLNSFWVEIHEIALKYEICLQIWASQCSTQGSTKRWVLGCVNSRPVARESGGKNYATKDPPLSRAL